MRGPGQTSKEYSSAPRRSQGKVLGICRHCLSPNAASSLPFLGIPRLNFSPTGSTDMSQQPEVV